MFYECIMIVSNYGSLSAVDISYTKCRLWDNAYRRQIWQEGRHWSKKIWGIDEEQNGLLCSIFLMLFVWSNINLLFGAYNFKWAITATFFCIFVFSTVNCKHVHYKISPMTGFEPRTSGIGSNCSANWATTTALRCLCSQLVFTLILWTLVMCFRGYESWCQQMSLFCHIERFCALA